MAVKKILTEPNKLLRQVSKSVEKVGGQERTLMDDMLDTMYAAPGIGLAAIQIGIPKRIIVIDISRDEKKKNPGTLLIQLLKIEIKKKQNTKKVACLYQVNLQKLKDLTPVKLNI